MDLQTFENLARLAGSRRAVLEGIRPGCTGDFGQLVTAIMRQTTGAWATWYGVSEAWLNGCMTAKWSGSLTDACETVITPWLE